VKTLDTYILCDGAVTATAMASPVDIPTIYIAGDSTVTDQIAEYPYVPKETFCGWGQALQGLLKPGIAVSNHAQSGSCTLAFIGTNWNAFKDKIKPGDVLVCEFGHNDQKIKELDAFGGYAEKLRYFVNYAKEKGAYPILNSPINRIIFEPDGTLKNLLGEYRNAVESVAKELDVPFIDMWARTTDYFVKAGPVKSWDFFRCKGEERDYTHTNDIGGTLIAKMFAQEIKKNKYLSRQKSK
jgi:lysophospholipase L1-like esterase